MKKFHFKILFAALFSINAFGSILPIELLVKIGDYSDDQNFFKKICYANLLNRYNLFGENKAKLFSFLEIRTPALFLTCKTMQSYLAINFPENKEAIPKDLEEQLKFLSGFKLSRKRRYFARQTYFGTDDGLITKRNSIILEKFPFFHNPCVFAFHATIDFYAQPPSKHFARDVDNTSTHKQLEKKDLEELAKKMTKQNSDLETLGSRYVDIGFLANFEWISQFFEKHPEYNKISLQDLCLISYLLSALDVHLHGILPSLNRLCEFLPTNESRKEFIRLLKKTKKEVAIIKNTMTDDMTDEEKRKAIWTILHPIFYTTRIIFYPTLTPSI